MSKLQPREALIIAPHVIVKADCSIDSVHPAHIDPETIFVLRNVMLKVGPFNDAISEAQLCLWVNFIGPLALLALQMVTIKAHCVVGMCTQNTKICCWIQEVFIVAL